MRAVSSVKEMRAAVRQAHLAGKRVGLVPTMGFLHDGHISLIRKAGELADLLVVSVYVNPTQFGAGEDFGRYPRDIRRDENLCREEGVDILFCPSTDEMYAPDHSTYVKETSLSTGLCGPSRPTHFRGVTTVVAKLFNIVEPDVAVFGRKDAQQARVIERMVRDLEFAVEVVVAATSRDPDGLATSSRNSYLSGEGRKSARCLFESLSLAERMFSEGVRDTKRIRDEMRRVVEKIAGIGVDYIEIVDYLTLKPVKEIVAPALVAVALRIAGTRLIDNVILRP